MTSRDALAGARPSPGSERWILAGLSLSMLLASLGTSIANVALPTLTAAFHASFQQVQWVVLSYLLTITALIVGVGRLGDLFGRRQVLLGGVALFTGGSILCGAAADIGTLIAARAVQGAGAAVMMALTLSLVAETASQERTGSAMGLLGTMSAIGTALGPSLGGFLIAAFGWQAIFFLCAGLGAVALALNYRHLPVDRATEARASFDAPGMIVLALALTAYALAMTLEKGHVGPTGLSLLLVAVLGAALFVRIEKKARSPLVELRMLRNGGLGGGLAMSALVTTVLMATLVVGPFYLAQALGLGAAGVGLVMSVGPVVAALTGVPAGRLVDRLGAQKMTAAGLAGVIGGSLLLAVLPRSLGAAGYIVSMMLMTSGYALFQAANNTAVMTGIGSGIRGVVSALLNLSRNLGLVTGASLMGAVFAFASGIDGTGSAADSAVAIGMRVTFAFGSLLGLAALAIALTARGQAQRTASA
jgi:MFS family permease